MKFQKIGLGQVVGLDGRHDTVLSRFPAGFEGRRIIGFRLPAGGIGKGLALVRENFGQVGVTLFHDQHVQPLFMVGPAAGSGAKTGGQGRVAGHANEGGCPVGV